MPLLKPSITWLRDPGNPILAPDPASEIDNCSCMNPFVIRVDDEYRLFYSGGSDKRTYQRICLATSTIDDPLCFERRGVVLDIGLPGSFNSRWCVLPYVKRFGSKWHLYYSGMDDQRRGLPSFRGIGLALSNDGLHFEPLSIEPIITGDQTPDFPHNKGIAGGGLILEDTLPDGRVLYRMYYTITNGTGNLDLSLPDDLKRTAHEKHCAVCHSFDGIEWFDHRIILSPRLEVPNEDIGVAAPYVWRDGSTCRMLYCGIGTRWYYYSISEAVSADGYIWDRGNAGENIALAPNEAAAWESQSVAYPCVIDDGGKKRLFYCGNDNGGTGIGTAAEL
jgi:predicted GH43/DUF377 family glycosyl hydrolase